MSNLDKQENTSNNEENKIIDNKSKLEGVENNIKDDENIFTPKHKKYITKNWSVINLVVKAKLFYLEENRKNKSIQMKEINFPYLMVLDKINEEIDEVETAKNIKKKMSYLVKEIEKRNQNIKINLETISEKQQVYEITYALQKGWTQKKKILANKKTIELLAEYHLSKNHLKYKEEGWIVKIERIEDQKDFFEKLATRRSGKFSISQKEMMVLTQKLASVIWNNPSSPANTILKEIISQVWPSWLKNVLIEVRQRIKEDNMDLIEAFRQYPEHFDTVFISMISAWFDKWWEWKMIALKELKNFTERNFVLNDTIKKAMRWPIWWVVFLMIIAWVLAVKSVPMITSMYEWLWAPVPWMTVLLWVMIDYIVNSWYTYIPFLIAVFLWLKFFFSNTFYWMKALHDFLLTMPILWNFLRNKDYESICTLIAMLAGPKTPAAYLKVTKKVIRNYHIKWVINTAINRVSIDKILPWEVLRKFPQYIDPRIAWILSKRDNPSEDLLMLKKIYASENDDFIQTFPMTIKPVMTIVMAWILIFLISATIFPIYWLLSAIE